MYNNSSDSDSDSSSPIKKLNKSNVNHDDVYIDNKPNDKKTLYEFFKKRTQTSFAKSLHNYIQNKRNNSVGRSYTNQNESITQPSNLRLLQKLNENSVSPKKYTIDSTSQSPIRNSATRLTNPKLKRDIDNNTNSSVNRFYNPFYGSNKSKLNILEDPAFKKSNNDNNLTATVEYQSPQKRIRSKINPINRVISTSTIDESDHKQTLESIVVTTAATTINATNTVAFSKTIESLQKKFFSDLGQIAKQHNEAKQQGKSHIYHVGRLIKFIEEYDFFNYNDLKELVIEIKNSNSEYNNYMNNIYVNTDKIIDNIRQLIADYEMETEEKIKDNVDRIKRIHNNEKEHNERLYNMLKTDVENLKYNLKLKEHNTCNCFHNKTTKPRNVIVQENGNNDNIAINVTEQSFNSDSKKNLMKYNHENLEGLEIENKNLKKELQTQLEYIKELKSKHLEQINELREEFGDITSRNRTTQALENENLELRQQIKLIEQESKIKYEDFKHLLEIKEKGLSHKKETISTNLQDKSENFLNFSCAFLRPWQDLKIIGFTKDN